MPSSTLRVEWFRFGSQILFLVPKQNLENVVAKRKSFIQRCSASCNAERCERHSQTEFGNENKNVTRQRSIWLWNVGLRYRAALDKLTRPTYVWNVGLRYRAALDKLTRPTYDCRGEPMCSPFLKLMALKHLGTRILNSLSGFNFIQRIYICGYFCFLYCCSGQASVAYCYS